MPPSFLLLVVCISSVLITGCSSMEISNKTSEYFITTPSTATVVVGFPGYNDTVYLGQFQCVTRVGFRLVWVINGLSADNIRSTPGFEDVSYELIPIQDTGNTLSILNIPASTGINGTIVTCTAVYNRSIEAHSLPVYLIVTQAADPTEGQSSSTAVAAAATTNDATGTSTSEDVSEVDMAREMSGARDHIRVSLHMMLGLAIGLSILAVTLAVAAMIICVVTAVIIKRRQRHKRLQGRGGPRENNIYSNSEVNSEVSLQNEEKEQLNDLLR